MSVCAVALMAVTSLCAQNAADSVRTHIRQIKLSEQYVYAEANSMDNPDAAADVAVGKLEAAAIDLMTQNGMAKAEIKETWKLASGKMMRMSYKNGPLHKIFVCVGKNELGVTPPPMPMLPEPKATAVTEQTKEETSRPVAEVPAAETARSVAEAPVVTPVIIPQVNPDIAAIEAVPDSTKQMMAQQMNLKPVTVENADMGAGKSDHFNVDTRMIDKVIAPLAMKGSASDEAVTQKIASIVAAGQTPKPQMTRKEQRVVDDVLAMQTYESVILYLNAMKEDGRLMYGPLAKAVRPERLFLIVMKDGKLLTVLYKGGRERVNLRNGNVVNLEKYVGHAIIWLQVFE